MLVYYILVVVVLVGAWSSKIWSHGLMSKSMDGVSSQLEVQFLPWSIFSSWSKIFFLTSTNNHFRIFYLSHTLFWLACEPLGSSGTIRIVPEYSLPVPSWYFIMVALACWLIMPKIVQLDILSGPSGERIWWPFSIGVETMRSLPIGFLCVSTYWYGWRALQLWDLPRPITHDFRLKSTRN